MKKLLDEMIKCRDDIFYFIENHLNIYDDEKLILYPRQKEILKDWITGKNNIVLSSRQSGMTLLHCIYSLYKGIFEDEYTILIPGKESQCTHHYNIIKTLISGSIFAPLVNISNKDTIQFINKSRIFFQPVTENGVRGCSIHLLILDNIDYINNVEIEEYWKSVIPTLSRTDGQIILTGTPKQTDSFMLKVFNSENDFIKNKIPYWQIPGRDSRWFQRILSAINFDINVWRQEFELS